METWLITTIIGITAFIIGFFIEPVRDIYEEAWEYISEALEYIISFQWLSDIGEFFSNGFEAITNIEDSPLTNVWFWAFYFCLMLGVWFLPSRMGLSDYTLFEKLTYTIIFFIVDWFIVSHFKNT
jgi:hypothetical protein